MNRRLNWMYIVLVAAAIVGQSTAGRAAETAMAALDPRTLKFIQIPDMPACASAAILRGNPRSGPAWVLLKLASGCRVPWHWHTANEDLVVISGRGTVAMKEGPPLEFVPGAYSNLPSHHAHQASCSRDCLLFNAADAAFDVHYVDASGEEIPPKEALKQPAKAPKQPAKAPKKPAKKKPKKK